jgi:hypothetical protein
MLLLEENTTAKTMFRVSFLNRVITINEVLTIVTVGSGVALREHKAAARIDKLK